MHQAVPKGRSPASVPFNPSEEEIRKHAYFLWKEEGSPAGRDLDLWLRAKELVRHHAASRSSRATPRRQTN
jgi:hypothetical protein